MELGLYETVMTAELERRLAGLVGREANVAAVDLADQTLVLARHVASALHVRLAAERDPAQRVQLANQLLALIASFESNVEDPLKQLRGIHQPTAPGATTRYAQRPKTPLNDAALLTNAPGEPSLASELKAEIYSADWIDLFCAFVMWRGPPLLEAPLEDREAGIPMRVITTTYIGGTEREALDRLVREFGARSRMQYDAARTRLHAKAWLFRRDRFDTAYVGSSNLSKCTARWPGVERPPLRVGNAGPAHKFEATFDSYWDARVRAVRPDVTAIVSTMRWPPRGAAERRSCHDLDLRAGGEPFPTNRRFWTRSTVEREVHDRHRNLVVAATGTGKTVVAALDYRRLCVEGRARRLLFVAHRVRS